MGIGELFSFFRVCQSQRPDTGDLVILIRRRVQGVRLVRKRDGVVLGFRGEVPGVLGLGLKLGEVLEAAVDRRPEMEFREIKLAEMFLELLHLLVAQGEVPVGVPGSYFDLHVPAFEVLPHLLLDLERLVSQV